MHTNYRLFVLIESDAVMLILSAGQQTSERQPRGAGFIRVVSIAVALRRDRSKRPERFFFGHPAELNHSCGADQHGGGRPSRSGQQIAHSDRQAPIQTEKVRGYGSGVLRYEDQQNDQEHQPDDERPPRRREPR